MAKEIKLNIGMPTVVLGSAERLEVEITRKPEGNFQKSENVPVAPDTESIEVKASPGTRLTVSVKAVDKKKRTSNTVTRHINVDDPMPPELADDITAEIAKPKKSE